MERWKRWQRWSRWKVEQVAEAAAVDVRTYLTSPLYPNSLRLGSISPADNPFCLSVSSHAGGTYEHEHQLGPPIHQ